MPVEGMSGQSVTYVRKDEPHSSPTNGSVFVLAIPKAVTPPTIKHT
jgi:hypothetical protein